jgi:hypothetical protein
MTFIPTNVPALGKQSDKHRIIVRIVLRRYRDSCNRPEVWENRPLVIDRPSAEAILSEPHNSQYLADAAATKAKVFRGPTQNGLGKNRSRSVASGSGELLNVVEVLRDINTDIGCPTSGSAPKGLLGGTRCRLLKATAYL